MTRSVLSGCMSLKSTVKAAWPRNLKIHETDENFAEHCNWKFTIVKCFLTCYLREPVSIVGLQKGHYCPIILYFCSHIVCSICDRHFVMQIFRRTISSDISKRSLCIKAFLPKASICYLTFLWSALSTPMTPYPQNSICQPICDV